MRHKHGLTWYVARNKENCGNRKMQTVGPGVRHENLKSGKMRNTQ